MVLLRECLLKPTTTGDLHLFINLVKQVWLRAKDLPLRVESKKLAPCFVGPFTVECIVNPSVVRLRLPSFLGFQGAEAMAGEGNRSNQQKQEQVCQYQSAATLTPYNQNPLIILCWIVSTYSQCLLTFSQAQFLYIVGKNLPLLVLVQTATCSFG